MAGGCVVCRRPEGELKDLHPQLWDALEAVPMANSPKSIRKQVRDFLRDQDARNQACARAREIISDHHLIRHRVATIREALAGLAGTS
jgi:hypothetical protein